MARYNPNTPVHEPTFKKTSQAGRKRSCKMSSMNKHKKRVPKFYRGQGK